MATHPTPTVLPSPAVAKVPAERLPGPGTVLSAVLHAAGLSHAWLAERMGRSLTELKRQLRGVHRLDLELIERAAPSVALAYYAARSAQLEAAHPVLGLEREHCQLGGACGELALAVGDAIADGRVDARESKTIRVKVAKVIREASDVGRACG